ncbi:MAG TPA: DNA primase [Clostridiaceae bacterium]|nr:DNA primase [Clostridiaceae bacterium]
MVRYSDELIDEIRNKNDIVDVISQYVTLKRSGRNFFGLCPFHKEKSPSFSVSPDKQIFHCFGCGVGGNVFHFLQKIENISFLEALESLANQAGINLPTLDNAVDDKLIRLKSKVYKINEIAANFYHERLYKPESKQAQDYIKKRKLDNKTLKNFLIGYSGNFNELYMELKRQGFTEEEILASCLVNKNENGKYIDRFRRRLMFPIQDTRNRIIAFGGRVLDDSKPKYINSPENIVYHKGRHLFGLNIAKKEEIKKIIIVEGYMDAISLHQRGIHNAVASLGTALTEQQGRLLRKSSEQIIIGYDADGAGQAATLRGLEILQNLGCDIRILQIYGAKDPDEFVTKYGPERFQKCVDNAISLVEYKIKMLKQKLNLENTNDKIKFLNEIAKVLAKVTNNIEREVYIEKISSDYHISKEAIYSEINKLLYKKKDNLKTTETASRVVIKKKEDEEIDEAVKKRESLLIYLLLQYPNQSYLKISNEISPNELKIEMNKKILSKLYEELQKGNSNTNNATDWFSDEETINYLTGIMAYDFEITELNKCIDDILYTYRKEKMISERNEIINKLEKKDLSTDEIANFEKRLSEIIVKLAKMK